MRLTPPLRPKLAVEILGEWWSDVYYGSRRAWKLCIFTLDDTVIGIFHARCEIGVSNWRHIRRVGWFWKPRVVRRGGSFEEDRVICLRYSSDATLWACFRCVSGRFRQDCKRARKVKAPDLLYFPSPPNSSPNKNARTQARFNLLFQATTSALEAPIVRPITSTIARIATYPMAVRLTNHKAESSAPEKPALQVVNAIRLENSVSGRSSAQETLRLAGHCGMVPQTSDIPRFSSHDRRTAQVFEIRSRTPWANQMGAPPACWHGTPCRRAGSNRTACRGQWRGGAETSPRALGNSARRENRIMARNNTSGRAAMKLSTTRGWREAQRSGGAFNHEPRHQRQRARNPMDWSAQRLMASARRDAKRWQESLRQAQEV